MNLDLVKTAQITGTVAIFFLFCIKLYIVANPIAWAKSGRVASLWTIIYIFFLFILRLINLQGTADMDALRIVSGYSAIIPLVAVIAHLFLFKQTSPVGDVTASIEEARQLVAEAKQMKLDAASTLADTKKRLDKTI